MKTVLELVRRAGGYRSVLHLRVENPPHPTLTVDALEDRGPCGLRALSVAHFTDALALPEMCFEWSQPFWLKPRLVPFAWRNDFLGIHRQSRWVEGTTYVFDPLWQEQLVHLAATWDKVLSHQNILAAFDHRQR